VGAAPQSASRAVLEAMREAGVRYLFANLGSDHTGIMEAYAQERRDGPSGTLPELLLCPHESVAEPPRAAWSRVHIGTARALHEQGFYART
jgi:acetolactate synthase I/II/III large subunit